MLLNELEFVHIEKISAN